MPHLVSLSTLVLTLAQGSLHLPPHLIPFFKAHPGIHARQTAPEHIIDGTLDNTGDPAVVELWYVFPDSGGLEADTCSGEMIGAQSYLTAGHCAANSEINPSNLPLCADDTCADNVFSGSNSTHAVQMVIFNDCATPSSAQSTCEQDMITAGRYIYLDHTTNDGYNPNGNPDNDIGLAHALAATPTNPGTFTMPSTLPVNSSASNIPNIGQFYSSIRFVGYGITSASAQTAGVKYTVTKNNFVEVYDQYHDEENGAGEPTCSGDSGGPSFYTIGGVETIVAVTSLGDVNCSTLGIDTRVDAYYSWIQSTLSGWGDHLGGTSTTTTSTGTTSTGTGTTGTGTTGTGTTGGSTTGGTTGGSTGGACNPGPGTPGNNGDLGNQCGSASDCATGEACTDVFGIGAPVCTVDCTTSGTCTSGICLSYSSTAAYCTPACLSQSSSCPSGDACQQLTPDSAELGYCSPIQCEQDSDCNQGNTSFTCSSSGICNCTQDSDCTSFQAGTACDTASGVCYQPCTGGCQNSCCATYNSTQYCDGFGVAGSTTTTTTTGTSGTTGTTSGTTTGSSTTGTTTTATTTTATTTTGAQTTGTGTGASAGVTTGGSSTGAHTTTTTGGASTTGHGTTTTTGGATTTTTGGSTGHGTTTAASSSGSTTSSGTAASTTTGGAVGTTGSSTSGGGGGGCGGCSTADGFGWLPALLVFRLGRRRKAKK